MRRQEKEVSEKGLVEAFLARLPVGRLVNNRTDGYPRIKPLNFVYYNGFIYFHSARAGEKIDDMARDDRVCFEVDEPIAIVKARKQACEATYLYRSLIIKGRASLVEDTAERYEALVSLMEKYQPQSGYGAFPEEKLALTAVIRIHVEESTMKEDLGKGWVREAVLKGLQEGRPLPFVVENP